MFRDASQRHSIDWPDAIWEQWLEYERVAGDTKSFGAAQRIVDRERGRVEKKREQAAAEQARAMEEYQLQFQAMQVGAAEAQVAEQASGEATEAMEVDPAAEPSAAPAPLSAPAPAPVPAPAPHAEGEIVKR